MLCTCGKSRRVLVSAVLAWVLMVGLGEARSHAQGTGTAAQGPTLGPVEVSEGFVILDGAYVRPPYTVHWTWPAAFVNGREALVSRQGGRSCVGEPEYEAQPRHYVEYVVNHLRGGGLILCRAGQKAVLVTPGRALRILEILLSEKAKEAKVKNLAAIKGLSITAREWDALAESFEAPTELTDRVEYWHTEFAALAAVGEADLPVPRGIIQMLTLAGFALAAWALGTLLRCRPPLGRDDAPSVAPGLWDRQVVRLVLVIVALSVHDLLCTLCAHDLGNFRELNPLAAPLLSHAPSVVAFKLSLTLGAAIVFLVARSRRLVQIGSWWMGVVYTVLILRWAAYGSLVVA